jgi:hypothetical protein
MRVDILKFKTYQYVLIVAILIIAYRLFIYTETPDIYVENTSNDSITIEFYPSGSIDTLKDEFGYTVMTAIIEVKFKNQVLKFPSIKKNLEKKSLTATLKKNESINITYFKGIGGLQDFDENNLDLLFDKIVICFSTNDSIVASGKKSIQHLFENSKLKFKIQ